LDWQFRDFWAIIQPFTDSFHLTQMVPQKPQVWSSCKAHDAMEWQRHFERHATPQMGRNCGFWAQRNGSRIIPFNS
jgi:hypothetical protein